MKKKYIITGLLVFIFSAIVIYLALDNGKKTYATSIEDFTFTIGYDAYENPEYVFIRWGEESAENQTFCNQLSSNGENFPFTWNSEIDECYVELQGTEYSKYYHSRNSNYCPNEDFQYDQEEEKCYYTPNTCPETVTGVSVQDGAIPKMYIDGNIDANCCYNILHAEQYDQYNSDEYSRCVIYAANTVNSDYYFEVPYATYCPNEEGFTYNSSTHRCVKNIESDPPAPENPILHKVVYKCSQDDISCTDMPEPNFVESETYTTFSITSSKPKRNGYTFLYWKTSSGKYHYYNSCQGVSDTNCHDKISLKPTTTLVTLYAVWKKNESSGSGGTTSNTNPKLSYACGTYNNKDIECNDLPDSQYTKKSNGGTLNISTKKPIDTSGKYEFSHWTHNPPKTYKYHPTCSGLSGCKTEITITKNNTLYANWIPKSGTSEPTNSIYLKFNCGSYQEGDSEYDVDCENLPEDTKAINGVGYIPNKTPIDKNGELEFLYWKSNYSALEGVTFCYSGCDKNQLKMTNNNYLYAVWQEKNAQSTGNYNIEYLCSNNEKCSEIPNTTGTKSTLTITNKIPTREGYIFLYWEPLSEYNDSKLYCNPSNRLDFDCYQTMRFTEEGTVKVKAVWMEENEELDPEDPLEPEPIKSSQSPDNVDNPGTGLSATYIAIILGLAMLGYSYYYFRKAKNN